MAKVLNAYLYCFWKRGGNAFGYWSRGWWSNSVQSSEERLRHQWEDDLRSMEGVRNQGDLQVRQV